MSNRRGVGERGPEPGVVDETPVGRAGDLRETVHGHAARFRTDGDCGIVRGVAAGRGRRDHGARDLFEVPPRERGHRVAEADHLALLGEADATVPTRRRARQDRPVRPTAAAGHGAAATVEEPQRDPGVPAGRCQAVLGLLQAPGARPVAAVLVAVAVAEHDLLEPTAGREVRRVDRMLEESRHHPLGPLEVLDGLEQRHHVDG